MLISFLIFDPSNFTLFEYFSDKQFANKIIDYVDNIQGEGQFSEGGLNYSVGYFDDKLRYCVVYKDEQYDENLAESLPKIATNVMKGDKVSLRQVLNSSSLKELSHVYCV